MAFSEGDEVWIIDADLPRHVFRRARFAEALSDGGFIVKGTEYMSSGGIIELDRVVERLEAYQGQDEWLAPDGTLLYPPARQQIKIETTYTRKRRSNKSLEELMGEMGDAVNKLGEAISRGLFGAMVTGAPPDEIVDMAGRRFRKYKGKDGVWILEPIADDEDQPRSLPGQ